MIINVQKLRQYFINFGDLTWTFAEIFLEEWGGGGAKIIPKLITIFL